MTPHARYLVVLQQYLGSQNVYNFFGVILTPTTSLGLIAIPREIPCSASDIPTGPFEHPPRSVPNSIRTTVPSTRHIYAAAAFCDGSLSDCTLQNFPVPVVFEVD